MTRMMRYLACGSSALLATAQLVAQTHGATSLLSAASVAPPRIEVWRGATRLLDTLTLAGGQVAMLTLRVYRNASDTVATANYQAAWVIPPWGAGVVPASATRGQRIAITALHDGAGEIQVGVVLPNVIAGAPPANAVVLIPFTVRSPDGSAYAICLRSGLDVMKAGSTHDGLVVAREIEGKLPWGTSTDSIGWAGYGTVTTLYFHAYVCGPGPKAIEITRNRTTVWASEDTAVATVDQHGVVKWKGPGPPRITVERP